MNTGVPTAFELDPRLVADTIHVVEWALCCVRLMNDARFPWLILVPQHPGLVDLDDLGADEAMRLVREVRRASRMLRHSADCDKLNVGALGNQVRQLHVHVVARREGDAAWPGPVWGSGPAQRYSTATHAAFVQRLRARDQP